MNLPHRPIPAHKLFTDIQSSRQRELVILSMIACPDKKAPASELPGKWHRA